MKIDTGLHDGVRAQRQNHQLLDLTLKVDNMEFRVHKIVLASVSDYFRARLCGSLKEKTKDVLQLKGVSVKQVCRLLVYIYTGDKTIADKYPKETLECRNKFKVNSELQDGVRALRQNDQLTDLTLKVDGQEFKVHKAVLASVSDYFHGMLCGSLKDSVCDTVDLKGISARQVSRFIDFVYTGENFVIESKPKEMLECGVYFQAPKIIQYCTERLTRSLRVRNCLDLLSMFLKFPASDGAQKIRDFIKANLRKVIDHYKPEEMTLQMIQVVLQNWKASEWELFNFLQSWMAADSDNRTEDMDDLLNQVRYKLMTPEEISAVKETVVFTDTKASWKGLVDEAFTYHQLPIHQKVLDKSIQNRVRHSKSVFVLDTHPDCSSPRAHILCKPGKGSGMQFWKKCPDVQPPPVAEHFPFAMEVNNFLITCSKAKGSTQHWQIFNPRTLTWHEMATMPRPRDDFVALYHMKHIYVLGGVKHAKFHNDDVCMDTIEEYSFETGTWRSTKKMPVPVTEFAACIFKDAIYVSGGRTETPPFRTARMDCLDLSSQKWKSKARLPQVEDMLFYRHKMFVAKIKMKDAIVVIYRNRDLKMDYYDPETDQWSNCNFSIPELQSPPKIQDRALKPVKSIRLSLFSSCKMIACGNTLFWLSVSGDLYNARKSHAQGLCVKWIIPEEKGKSDIVQIRLRDDPVEEKESYDEFPVIWGMLAFPPQSATKEE